MPSPEPRAGSPRPGPPATWLSDEQATLMAVVNVNPDSFSDPRDTTDQDERLATARTAVAEGAAVVDLGAQSAALAAAEVPPATQAAALAPLVRTLHAEGVVVSVDTHEPEVARSVLDAGAAIVNDFSGAVHPEVVTATAEAGAWYVLTHNPTGPRVRQTDADAYDDVVDAVLAHFDRVVPELVRAGLPADRLLLDPGVDAGKTPRQTLELLRGRGRIRSALQLPLLWAVSRKDVLGALTGRRPAERDPATHALLAGLADHPRTLVRVHDVAAARDVLRVCDALAGRVELSDALLDDALRRQAD